MYIGISLVIVGILLFLLVTKRGQQFIALLVVFLSGWALWAAFLSSSDFETFVAENNIQLADQSPQIDFPVLGENQTSYYLFRNESQYYHISKNNNCPGFKPNNLQSWCTLNDNPLPKCIPGTEDHCGVILVQ